jgi:hypothetical protein
VKILSTALDLSDINSLAPIDVHILEFESFHYLFNRIAEVNKHWLETPDAAELNKLCSLTSWHMSCVIQPLHHHRLTIAIGECRLTFLRGLHSPLDLNRTSCRSRASAPCGSAVRVSHGRVCVCAHVRACVRACVFACLCMCVCGGCMLAC